MISSIRNISKNILRRFKSRLSPDLGYLREQDLSRFSDQDIILDTDDEIRKYLPDVLGQALARAWVDQRFMDAFIHFPLEILEHGGVYLPERIKVEFSKEGMARPKVTVFERTQRGQKKILELKLIMVAEE